MVGRTTLRRAAGAAQTAALISLGGASSASAAVVPGGLVSIGCLAPNTSTGCAAAHDLAASFNVIASPDGKNVYVATANALLTFKRDPGGQLTQMAGQD